MSKGKITAEQLNASAWAAALASPLVPDKVPPGWHTARELGAKLGKADSTIGTMLTRAVRNGRAEMKRFRILSGQRGLYPTPHYRLLQ